jgi:hypothetical protein
MDLTKSVVVDVEQIISVVRRDMLGHECLRCFEGTYQEAATIVGQKFELSCDNCGDEINRWLSKSEMSLHTSVD